MEASHVIVPAVLLTLVVLISAVDGTLTWREFHGGVAGIHAAATLILQYNGREVAAGISFVVVFCALTRLYLTRPRPPWWDGQHERIEAKEDR